MKWDKQEYPRLSPRTCNRFLNLGVLSLCAAAIGCSGGSNTPAPMSALETQALAQAPQDWAAFKVWCEEQLRKEISPVALPDNPNLAAPQWPVVRLLDQYPKAKIECSWAADATSKPVLLHLGPFRSDADTETFASQSQFDRQIGQFLEMHVKGFALKCEDIGAIALTIHAPYGSFVDLIWATAGQIRVPVPDNRQRWTLNVATDGLSEWSGPLQDLILRSDGMKSGTFEIEAIDFLPRQKLFDKPADICRTTIDHIRHDAFYVHTPATVTFPSINLANKLSFSVASVRNENSGDHSTSDAGETLSIEVSARRGELIVPLLKHQVLQSDKWNDLSASLGNLGGPVELTFRFASSAPDRVALVGVPTMYSPVENPPIYLVYLIDTLGARHMSLYGYERETTPRLKQLAQRGVWFDEMRTQAPVTVASLPHMVLSMPTERHGVYSTSIAIPLALVTMAESFQAAGYATGSFVTSEFAGPRQNMDQGFDYFSNQVSVFWRDPQVDRTVPIDEVLAWLQKHRDRPAFIYVHTAEPHAPYTPPPGFAGKFDPNYSGSFDGTMNPTRGFLAAKTPRDIEHIRALYDEEVLYADQRFGMFEDALKSAGLLDRTTMFVLADHGEELQEHGNWGHGPALYDEVLRIPLIAAGPGITAHGRNNANVCMYDVLPTILDLARLPHPYPLSGASLSGTLTGRKPPSQTDNRTLIVSHFKNHGFGILDYSVTEALRWKLHLRTETKGELNQILYELYDLKTDPFEKTNLIDKEHEVARRLGARLVAYHRQQQPYATDSPALRYDPRQLRDLRSMGYVGQDAPKE